MPDQNQNQQRKGSSTFQPKALRWFLVIRAADELGSQVLNIAVGWYLYTATHSPMSLAYAGLVQFLPNIALAPIAGHAADRLDRRSLVRLCFLWQAFCLALFFAKGLSQPRGTAAIYVLLLSLGASRTFVSPALSALLPTLVDDWAFPRAVAASSSVLQVCSIAGPAVGGVILAIAGTRPFTAIGGLFLLAAVLTQCLPAGRHTPESKPVDDGVLAGLRYIWGNRLLRALTSLDLFAVLLGGVTALLPIYAKDILGVGPDGLGWLRCAPGAGAAFVGFLLARRSLRRRPGQFMLFCVAGFGCATILFAISRNYWLSLAALTAAGGFDMVSMVIRETLVQTSTPGSMRGRVSAVHDVCIGVSSEVGAFESGATAALWGVVPAALVGGVGTLAVVALWNWLFPEISRAGPPPQAPTNDETPETIGPLDALVG